MASEPQPGSTGGATRTPPLAASAAAAPRGSSVQQCVQLDDWWLERVEGEEGKIRIAGIAATRKGGASSSTGNRKVAARVFRSAAIGKRRDQHSVETEDGYKIRIDHLLNIPRTRDNGFTEEVCKSFEFGFPMQWLELVNPNMVQQDEQAQSESTDDEQEVEFWKYLSDKCTNLMTYEYEVNDPSAGYTSNTDGPLSNLPDGNAGNMAASEGLYGGRTNVPGKPNSASSDSGKQGTPKCSKAPVNLGGTDALELPTERMTQFVAVQGSEDSPVRRLRSGKVFGTPSSGLMKSRHKKRKIQHEASSQNMIPNEGDTSTAGLTSHENDSSAAGVVTKDKQKSHDSHRGTSAKKAKKRKESSKLFWNWC